ncbi:hypothetical protein TrVE_jg4014 [Triparma verrucosa]|uniref:Major facilitator superfamily (MFS) profile domain-containing protein n=1 Tax=Triparma verrucosa TaxID=1606542 RepID=A0A9W6Z7I2_9STRA|nr:hypothetical protein TrVE_jg4014 [Triparma verrucosa]
MRLNEHQDIKSAATVPEILTALPECSFPYTTICTVSVGLLSLSDSSEVLLLSFLPELLPWDNMNIPLLMSSTFIGELIGSVLLTPLADIYGRRPVSLFSSFTILCAGILSSLSPNFPIFLLTRLVVGIGIGALSGPYDLLAELLPPKARGKKLLEVQYYWTLGSLLPILFLTLTKNWRVFTFLCSLPSFITFTTFLVYSCESPEWLLTQRRNEEARTILKWIYKWHGYKGNFEDTLLKPSVSLVSHDSKSDTKCLSNVHRLFERDVLPVTVPLFMVWFCFGFGYYGLVFLTSRIFTEEGGEGGGEGGNEEIFDTVSITLSALSEFLGTTVVWFTIDSLGRRKSQTFSYTFAAIGVILMSFNIGTTFFSIIGRAAMMASTSVTWLHTPEVLHTSYRGTGHAFANGVARVGAFLCPYVVGNFSVKGAGTFISLVTFVAVFAANKLPESVEERGGGGEGKEGREEDEEMEMIELDHADEEGMDMTPMAPVMIEL